MEYLLTNHIWNQILISNANKINVFYFIFLFDIDFNYILFLNLNAVGNNIDINDYVCDNKLM